LKPLRTNNFAGISGSFQILNFSASLTLTVGNINKVQFACVRRNLPTGNTLSIVVSQAASTALTPKMAGTSLLIQVLEPLL